MPPSTSTGRPTADVGVADDVTALDAPSDGRAARAARTRTAIVDALLSLLQEGDLQPPATRIADRAGISLRLIYHHFGDLESLFRATAMRQAERMAAMARPIDCTLPVDERLDAFCEERARMLEWITPVRRASLLHEPFSEELSRARDALVTIADQYVVSMFADDLAAFGEPERSERLAAMCTIASWAAWDQMRQAGSEPEQACAVMRRAMGALLGR